MLNQWKHPAENTTITEGPIGYNCIRRLNQYTFPRVWHLSPDIYSDIHYGIDFILTSPHQTQRVEIQIFRLSFSTDPDLSVHSYHLVHQHHRSLCPFIPSILKSSAQDFLLLTLVTHHQCHLSFITLCHSSLCHSASILVLIPTRHHMSINTWWI